jgi:hypothetical protein
MTAEPFSSPVELERARRARGALGAGGALVLVGLAMVGIGPSQLGMVVTLLALAMTIYGIHTFGRLGPDAGASMVKKKKKKPKDTAPQAG